LPSAFEKLSSVGENTKSGGISMACPSVLKAVISIHSSGKKNRKASR